MRALTFEERESTAHIELRRKFTESCKTVLGPKATLGNFTPDKLTPEWEIYKDDEQEGTADEPPEELKPTTEANNNYVNV